MFMLIHGNVNGGISVVDWFQILSHGLSMDMSVSGYLTIIPLFLLIASVWTQKVFLKRMMNIYFSIILTIIVIISMIDVMLYKHWGFHLDPVVLFYLRNPIETFASGTVWEWLLGAVFTFLIIRGLYYGYCFTVRDLLIRQSRPRHPVLTCMVLVILSGVLFLPIRGGVTVSTMNISTAYFSDRMFLNHAAINPVFNFFYLLNKHDHFEAQYQFFEKDEAARIFNRLSHQPERVVSQDFDQSGEQPGFAARPSLLRVERPNIILFILESFSYKIAADSIYAPNLNKLAKEGIMFEHFYANSFRTDRGLVSILSGYPGHPTTAILKYPKKTDLLPAIPKYLESNGYTNQTLYYGGDVNFANMRSYFVGACGIDNIVSDKNFPIKKRLTKWGVPDQGVIDRVFHDLTETKPDEPFLKVVLTLSSHEPFDVPTQLFDVPFLNSIRYVDECLGQFVSDLQSTDLWDNTLIVFIADHAMQSYPAGLNNYDKSRFQIPMIWIGGAVRQPAVISDYGSQNDLAATLLSQLGIDHTDFRFSKDMLHPQGRKFSFYSYVNGFCMMDLTSIFLYDNNQQKTLQQTGDPSMEKEAKAFFQMMYIDLGNR